MKAALPLITALFLIALASLAFAQNEPPSLLDFHQLYGSVTSLPSGSFTLRATVNSNQFTTPIAADARYGYSPVFRVRGQTGQKITFEVLNSLGVPTALVQNLTYEPGAQTLLVLQYPAPAQATRGCTNPSALNYNASATIDDGSCTYPAAAPQNATGCTIQQAINYNVSVTNDNGSCVFPANVTWGCRNQSAANYNPNATIQYGQCLFVPPASPIAGCTHPLATNYNPNATVNTTACRYPAAGECRQNWECGGWGSCLSGVQSRTCFRVDICDEQLARREIAEIIEATRPEERRACEEAVAGAGICTPDSKRCSGNTLEQCSFDGSSWQTLEFCTDGCNSVTLRCREEAPLPPVTESRQPAAKPGIPVWVYYGAGSLLLLVIIIIIISSIAGQKKLAPAKEYIVEARGKGFSDTQIRQRLLQEGWEEKKVGKLLK